MWVMRYSPADEAEALAKFQEEGLEVITEEGFEIGLGDSVRLGDFEELEDVGIAEEIGWDGGNLFFRGELEDGVLVLPCGKAEE